MKVTKKILSVLLAVMMVVTMLPLTALAKTTTSAEDTAAKNLMAQIEAYEAKMDGSKFYTNLSAAYTAYTQANQAYAAYVYGDDQSVDVSGRTTALKNAIANMQEWKAPTITSATGTWPEDALPGSWANSGAYVNLAYAGSANTDQIAKSVDVNGADKQTDFYVRYTPATMVYDGVTIPSMPVMAVLYGDSGKDRYYYSITLTDNDGNSLYLDGNWKGKADSGKNWDYSYQRWDSSAGQDRVGTGSTSSSFAAQVSKKNTAWIGSNAWAHPEGDTNYIHYNNDFADGVYYKEITPTFMTYAGSATGFTNSDIVMGGAANTKIAVINYKAIPDALAKYATKLNMQGRHYAHGGAAALMAAYDAAMNYTVNLNGGNDYVACANQIKTLVDNIKNTEKTLDYVAYEDLRAAAKASVNTYNSDAWESYTTESWTRFATAYEAMQQCYKNVYNNGGFKDPTTAQTVADELVAAKNALELDASVDPADTFIIENTIDDALVAIANKNFFTTASYNSANLEALTAQAQTEIWGNVDSYKDMASVVDVDSQDMVDEWVVTIGEAIAVLEINKATTVGEANGYSLTSALAEAATKNPEDYANYVDLETAVAEAKKFEAKVITDTTDTSTFRKGIVETKIEEYKETVVAVVNAIINLHISFAKVGNGEIASTTSNKVSFETGGNSNKSSYKVSYEYNDSIVMFRTSHNASTYKLPNASISFYKNPNAGDSKIKEGYLDSVNINSTESGDKGEITSNYDNNDHSMNDSQIAQYPGNLVISKNGYTYTLGRHSKVAGTGIFGTEMSQGWTNGFGTDANGTNITSTAFDFTDVLKTTNGKSSGSTGPSGSIIAQDGTTYVTASSTLDAPAISGTSIAKTTVQIADNAHFGSVIRWTAPGVFGRVYYGYTYNTVDYSQKVEIVDITTLLDLIKECDALQRANYTTSSWEAFKNEIVAAKGEMNYGSMTADQIVAECQARYNKLLAAKNALVEAATNDVIDDALAQASAIKNSGVKYTKASLAVFNTAFDEAVAAINGTYTDDKCLDLLKTEHQATIDAIAKKLTDAIKTLDTLADYTALENAYAALTTALNADKTYSATSLKNLKNVVEKAVYLYKTAEDKENIGGSQQNDINAEATAINNAITALEEVDVTVVNSAKAQLQAMEKDPDAYNVAGALKYIEDATKDVTEQVTILDITLDATKLTQKDADYIATHAVTDIAESIMVYTVYVDGVAKENVPFGETVTIELDAKSDVFYAYKSNTTENGKKYFCTDTKVTFVVKGNTWLTTAPVENTTEQHKVTFVSGVNNKTIAVAYVNDGEDVEIPTAPSIAFHTFDGYQVEGVEFDGKNITSDVTVKAVYTAETTVITITSYNDKDTNSVEDILTTDYAYNDKVTLTYSGALYWAKFDSEEKFYDWVDQPEGADVSYTIAAAGESYTFYAHEDAFFAPLTQSFLDADIEAGFVDEDALTAPTVTTATGYVNASTKISFVSSYYAAGVAEDDIIEMGLLVAKKSGLDLTDISKTSVGENQVYRLKSSQHTEGNQFVISLSTKSMPAGQDFSLVAYVIYKDADGNQQIVYGNNEQVVYTK